MTDREFFALMGPLVAPMLEEGWGRRDLCILATRVAVETARFFGFQAAPMPVSMVVYNAAFAKHVDVNFADVDDPYTPSSWGDGSWSVGIKSQMPERPNQWNGHLIAIANDCFGDFSIQQAERLQHGIHTGTALVGPYRGERMWKATNQTGTVVEYSRMTSDRWRNAPDWTDKCRRRPIVGKLIRILRAAMEVTGGGKLHMV